MTREIGLGIDAGGTFTKILAVDRRGRVLRETRIETLPRRGPRDFVLRASAEAAALTRALKRPVRGAGLGLAGDVDSDKGLLRFSPNLRGLSRFPFKGAFRAALKRPVAVENDANMAAWGGYVVELGRKPRNLVAVAMGTGVGGGLVAEGRLYSGSTGSAGEIGHTQVSVGGPLCNCGGRGHLEAYAGAYGIVRHARELLRGGRRSLLRTLSPDLSRLEPRHIAEAAEAGDALAREVWERTGTFLGIGIANAVYLFNPDAVLVVGGVSRAGRLILEPVRKVLDAQVFRTPFDRARVTIAKTPNLGAVGAALLGLEQ